jgi:hypothetical protein
MVSGFNNEVLKKLMMHMQMGKAIKKGGGLTIGRSSQLVK